MLTQKDFRDQVGDAAVVWINPRTVLRHAGTKWPVGKHRVKQLKKWLPPLAINLLKTGIKAREPFVIPSGIGPQPRPVEDDLRYTRVADFAKNRDSVESSLWFQDLIAELDEKGVAIHKEIIMNDVAAVRAFFADYVEPLFTSLERDTYDDPLGGFKSTAILDETGAICKTGSGNHRFFMCRVLGVEAFPLRVVSIHQAWAGPTPSVSGALDLIHAAAEKHK